MTATAKTKCCERLTPSDTETLNVVVLNTEPKMSVVFFFQAEDGIRDWSVTGVQTCALPISLPGRLDRTADDPNVAQPLAGFVLFDVERASFGHHARGEPVAIGFLRRRSQCHERGAHEVDRSEERRVGKAWKWRGARGRIKTA